MCDKVKNKWIAVVKKVYKNDGKIFAGHLQHKYKHLYEQGIWIFGDWGKALYAAWIDPNLYFVHHKWRKRKRSGVISGVAKGKQ